MTPVEWLERDYDSAMKPSDVYDEDEGLAFYCTVVPAGTSHVVRPMFQILREGC
ncbi:hypothetical protein [Streptomyces sp. S1]|uniref:hypothetical protein n=1 Tax=Streptomyces sp. S1 TaxID=718288 RepID=UPI003D74A97D